MKAPVKTALLRAEDHFKHDDFPLLVAVRDPQPEFERHGHQFTELLIITKGSAVHLIDDREYPLGEGDVFVINQHREHQFVELEDLSLINIIFDFKGLNLSSWHLDDLSGFRALFHLEPEYRVDHHFESRLTLDKSELQEILRMIDDLKAGLSGEQPGFKAVSLSLFFQLLVYLSRCYEKSHKPRNLSLLYIARAINYLESHFNTEINYETLSDIAHMSQRNFQRVFKRTMNCTARDYLLNLRLEYSCEMLKSGNSSVTQTAFSSGFNDSNYYTRKFKEKYGVSPRQYRHA